jgi:histidine ammonia-lyase
MPRSTSAKAELSPPQSAPEIVRLMLLLKAKGLVLGNSGVRPVVVDYLLHFFNENCLPIVFDQGSLGASGDLAPLAHLTLPLLGFEQVEFCGDTIPAPEALRRLGLEALDFIHPLKAGKGVEAAHAELRKSIPFAETDRLFHDDIQAALELVRSGTLVEAAEAAVGPLIAL